MRKFETQVPAKWVLTGEHSVLRGAAAVALPHPEFGLYLKFEPDRDGKIKVEQPIIREILAAIPGLPELSGKLEIESTIPIGAGLGSSAALCVALTRWLSEPLKLAEADWLDFATGLEHRFHGKSSGMDVAVISAGTPVSFVRGEGSRALGMKRLPRFTFHDTELRARTSDCVEQVERYRSEHPVDGSHLDEQMGTASMVAIEGLRLYDGGDKAAGLERVAHAMELSHRCFVKWGLVPEQALALHRRLMGEGARAARITGAGRGGMIVALWD